MPSSTVVFDGRRIRYPTSKSLVRIMQSLDISSDRAMMQASLRPGSRLAVYGLGKSDQLPRDRIKCTRVTLGRFRPRSLKSLSAKWITTGDRPSLSRDPSHCCRLRRPRHRKSLQTRRFVGLGKVARALAISFESLLKARSTTSATEGANSIVLRAPPGERIRSIALH
jgi:hypothetical protein